MLTNQIQHFRLGEILLGREVITSKQLYRALMQQREDGGRLGDILIASKVISKSDLAKALAEQSWRQRGYGWNKRFMSSLWRADSSLHMLCHHKIG